MFYDNKEELFLVISKRTMYALTASAYKEVELVNESDLPRYLKSDVAALYRIDMDKLTQVTLEFKVHDMAEESG